MNWKLFWCIIVGIYLLHSILRIVSMIAIFYSKSKRFAPVRSRLWWLTKKVILRRVKGNPFAYPVAMYLELNPEPKCEFIANGYDSLIVKVEERINKIIDDISRMRLLKRPEYHESELDSDEHEFINKWEEREKQQSNSKLN